MYYLKKSLLKIPGVEKTAYSDAWIGENHGKSSVGEKGKEVLCNFFSVDPDFIDLMGIPMVEGRSYSWLNSSDSVNSIIMNEAAAKALELKNAIGTIFQKKILTGITSDFYYFSLKNSMEPLIIRRLNEKPRVLTIRLTEQNQNRTLDKIMKTCKEISPEFKNRVSTVKDSLNNNYSVERRLSKGIGIYAFIALLLSLIGIAGISIIRVQKKRKEIAIRRILGASVSEVSLLILRGSIHWVVISNLVSIPIILYISNLWLESYANRIDVSPIPFSITLLSTTLVTILVILVITFRACKAVPAEVLREE